MLTRVVNIRTQTDLNASIYVGRRCKHPTFGWLTGNYFANPFKVGLKATPEDRHECVERYRRWLIRTLATDEGWRLFRSLACVVRDTGKPLACWCGNYPEDLGLLCHAVVLAEKIDAFLAGKE